MAEEKKESEKVDAELEIEPKKEEEKIDEKTELQSKVEEQRQTIQALKSDLGRVPALQSEIDSLKNTMDEKINNLLNARQTTAATDDVTEISDDDYVMGKDLKKIIDTKVKAATGNQEEVVERILRAREGKKSEYDKEYLSEVAKRSMNIVKEEDLKAVLREMDDNFREDTGNAKADAKSNYILGENAYLKKANAASKKVEFGSGKAPVAPLGIGGGLKEKIIVREEPEIKMPEDAKKLLADLEPDAEKRKVLAKEALR